MVSPHKIRYNHISSNELNILDLIMEVSFDSDNGEVSTYLNREAVVSETYDGRRKHVGRYKYNESFSPKFTFVKKNFGDFSQDEVRQVLKWLTSKDTTAVLDVFYDHADDSEIVDWACIGNWTEISTYKLGNNRTVGITATFEAVTPFAMSDIQTITKTISNPAENKITIDIDTDDNKPVYPRITIQERGIVVSIPAGVEYTFLADMVPNTIYSNGTTCYWKTDGEPIRRSSKTKPNYNWEVAQIEKDYTDEDVMSDGVLYYNPNSQTYFWIDPYTFHSDSVNNMPNLNTTSVRIINRHYDFFNQPSAPVTTVVKNNTATEQITVDGANQIISSTNTRRIFGDDFDRTWLPLYDGKNEITVEGNCDITFEYREVRKVGEW